MPTINQEKYQQALLYFISADIRHLGKVKLMKLLYYLDFDHYAQFGTSVTGEQYKNQKMGPLGNQATYLLNDMNEQGLITIAQEEIGHPYQPRTVYSANREPNLAVFSATERDMLLLVAEKWRHHTKQEIVDASHADIPWKATSEGDDIPYELVLKRSEYTEEEMEDWTEEDRKNYQQLLRATADFTYEMNLKGALYQEILDAYQDIENGNGLIEYVTLDS